MNKHSCRGFEARFNRKGEKGISVEKSDSEDAPYKIVYRTIEMNRQNALIEEVSVSNLSMDLNLSGEVNIKYCPWCGIKL